MNIFYSRQQFKYSFLINNSMWQIYYLEGVASQLDNGKLCLPFCPFNWLPSVTFIKTLTFNVNFIIWAGIWVWHWAHLANPQWLGVLELLERPGQLLLTFAVEYQGLALQCHCCWSWVWRNSFKDLFELYTFFGIWIFIFDEISWFLKCWGWTSFPNLFSKVWYMCHY